MSLTTINASKELAQGYAPLYLFDFTFPDGATLHVCEHALTYSGVAYSARVTGQQMGAIEALSSSGINVPPDVRITLANADGAMLALDQAHGFKGARVSVRFVFYDWSTGAFSSDSMVPFIGRCSTPEITDELLTVSAGFILNLAAKNVPSFPIQQRCPKVKPRTAGQVALRDDPDSIFYACGSGTTADCGYVKAGCAAQNNPLRFGGCPYEIPPASRSREYKTGNWLENLKSDPCAAAYGDYAPIGFGTGWVDCKVLGSWPEGNSMRGEAIVCEGKPRRIITVSCNDEILPPTNSIDGASYPVKDPLFRYSIISTGDRTGALNADAPWNGNGDPHGSLCVIEWVIYRDAAESTPRVRALVEFESVDWYQQIDSITDGVVTFGGNAINMNLSATGMAAAVQGCSNAALDGTYALASYTQGPPGTATLTGMASGTGTGGRVSFKSSSSNAVWAIFALLKRAGLNPGDFDLDAAARASKRATDWISYVDLDGNTSTHPRYSCSFVISQRRAVSDVLTGLLRSCNCHLSRNLTTGQVSLVERSSLAVQQPAAVDGSNDNTPIDSGYLAYHFSESSIARDSSGKSTLRRVGRSAGASPNSITISFSNMERDFSGDSARIVDTTDINRMGQEISGSIPVEGINSLDQAKRIGATYLAEQLYGETYVWQTSVKGLKLAAGALVALTSVAMNMDAQLLRVQKFAPGANSGRIEITATLHSDDWYADTYGQSDDPGRGEDGIELRRRPWPWHPGWARGAKDSMFTEASFGVHEQYQTNADGSAVAQLALFGVMPATSLQGNEKPQITSVTTAATGGTIPGGFTYRIWTYWFDSMAAHTVDLIYVPAGTNTNTITIIYSTSAHPNLAIYAGLSDEDMHFQALGTASPNVLTSLDLGSYGPPDPLLDHYLITLRNETPGVWILPIAQAGNTGTRTMRFSGVAWSTNEWAGRDVSLISYSAARFGNQIPFINVRVLSNSADTLTLDTTSLGSLTPLVGARIVMRTSGTATPKTYQDTAWTLVVDAHAGRMARVIAGTGAGQDPRLITANTADTITIGSKWYPSLDSTSRVVIEDAERSEITVSSLLTDAQQSSTLFAAVSIPNVSAGVFQVRVLTVSAGGLMRGDFTAPFREIYVNGARGGLMGAREGYYLVPTVTGHKTPDLSRGANQEIVLDANGLVIDAPAGALGSGTFSMLLVQDATGGRAATMAGDYFGVDLAGLSLIANTASWLNCKILDDGSILTSVQATGVSWI